MCVHDIPEEVLDPLGNHMGWVTALPGHQQASEHTHRPTVADLPQFTVYAQLLQATCRFEYRCIWKMQQEPHVLYICMHT